MNPQRNRHPFDRETDGPHQKTLLSIACQYVPGWNQVRAGRRGRRPLQDRGSDGHEQVQCLRLVQGNKAGSPARPDDDAGGPSCAALRNGSNTSPSWRRSCEGRRRSRRDGSTAKASPQGARRRSPADPGAAPCRPGGHRPGQGTLTRDTSAHVVLVDTDRPGNTDRRTSSPSSW